MCTNDLALYNIQKCRTGLHIMYKNDGFLYYVQKCQVFILFILCTKVAVHYIMYKSAGALYYEKVAVLCSMIKTKCTSSKN